MAFAFSVVGNVPQLTQSGTDTNLSGIATAITAVATVARSTAYTTAQMIKSPTPTGFWYRCSTAGTSAATAPTYGTTLGGTTTDGTAVFTAFKAPDVQTLGTLNHYYMPAIRVQINGTLTNENPQQENFTCFDLIINGGNFTSGKWATDGTTPFWNGLHFVTTRVSSNGADESTPSFKMQSSAQCRFIGGEVQVAGAIVFDNATTPRSYKTRWRNTKEWGGVTSSRIRSQTTLLDFQNVELYDIAYDLFKMPTIPPSIVARGSEYLYQYVGAGFGGADAKFSAYALENVGGTYDFDNFASGWVELYNCAKGETLNVVTQHPSSTFWVKHCVPLFQEIRLTAKDTAGNPIENVRFNCTDIPANSPTVTFVTAGNLKTWDFRNPLTYETTTNSSGIALSTPVLNVWYWQTSFKENLRFPASTATYQGRAYNYKTAPFSIVLGSNSIQDLTAGMIALDTATTVTESAASAITGISLVPSGATGGTITISANRSYQDIWNYYRWWISQFVNDTSNDTWTCSGNVLNTQNWNIVVNTGVTLSDSTNIKVLKTLGTITLNGTAQITGLYSSVAGDSTIWEFQSVEPNTSIAIYNSTGTVLYYNAVTTLGNYRYYIAPGTTGAYTYAIEKYGTRREEGTFPANAGGILFYVPRYADDFGISEPTLATVLAYTSIDTLDKLYDYTAVYRLSQAGIVKGQIATRAGTAVDLGSFGLVVNNSPAGGALYSVTGTTITVKSNILSNGLKYTLATSTATIVPNTTEIIAADIEDANGDSSVNILGGSGNFTLWKIPNATPEDNYATGTNLGNFTNQKIRFVSAPGFKIVIRDNTTGFRQVISMDKGIYEAGMFFGSQIQLAQANDIPVILDKMNQSLLEHIIINNGIKKSSLIIPHTTSL